MKRRTDVGMRVLALSASIVLAATACGSDSDSGDSGDEPTTLVVWEPKSYGDDTPYSKLFDQINKEFMDANPGIKIDHVAYPLADYDARLQTAVASQSGPDVFFHSAFGDQFFDSIIPADEFFTDEQKEQVLAVDARMSAEHERTLMMPYGLNANIILYNKELFSQAGLDPEQPPKTLDDMLTACDALGAAGITPMSVGMQDGVWAMFFPLILSAQTFTPEEQLLSQKNELPYTSDAYRAAFDATVELYEHGCFGEDALTKPSGDTYPDFEAGTTAMQPNNSIPPAMHDALGEGNVGFVLYPKLPESKYDHDVTSAGATGGWMIAKWSENAEAAWKYITFLTNPHGQELLWEYTRVVPNNTEVDVSSMETLPVEEQYLNVLLKTPGIIKYGANVGTPSFQDLFTKQVPQVLAGDLSVDDFLNSLEKHRQEDTGQ